MKNLIVRVGNWVDDRIFNHRWPWVCCALTELSFPGLDYEGPERRGR